MSDYISSRSTIGQLYDAVTGNRPKFDKKLVNLDDVVEYDNTVNDLDDGVFYLYTMPVRGASGILGAVLRSSTQRAIPSTSSKLLPLGTVSSVSATTSSSVPAIMNNLLARIKNVNGYSVTQIRDMFAPHLKEFSSLQLSWLAKEFSKRGLSPNDIKVIFGY